MSYYSDLHIQMMEDGELEEQNNPTPDEIHVPEAGIMEDLDDIVGLGEQVAKNKLTYSFRGIFGGQR